ncbi:MAG: PepSY-like domain-containing protein [Chryseolinea sp.]
MKKIVIFMVAMVFASFLHAQHVKSIEVPVVVKDSFLRKFPGAKAVKWSKENEMEFEAEFLVNGVALASNFDQSGKWLVTETEMKVTELPKPVQDVISKDFSNVKISEVEKGETSDGVFYEVEFKNKSVVQFGKDGKIMKKEKGVED